MKHAKTLASLLIMQCAIAHIGYAQESDGTQTEITEQDELLLQALESVFPMSPDEIGLLRKNRDMVEEAVTKTPIATISSGSRQLLLEPGQIPSPVVLTPGYVGAVAFFDSTGAPWPVNRAVIGNDAMFNLVSSGTGASSEEADVSAVGDAHVLYITPLREHANSNILIHLENAPNPVVVQLIADPSSKIGRRHEGITNFMVRARGPNAKQPVFTGVSPTINDTMMALLDGVPPQGASRISARQEIDGVTFWKIGDKLYMRSIHTLRWPAYTAYAESGGIYVYEMTPVPSIMISENGASVSIILDEAK